MFPGHTHKTNRPRSSYTDSPAPELPPRMARSKAMMVATTFLTCAAFASLVIHVSRRWMVTDGGKPFRSTPTRFFENRYITTGTSPP